MRDETDRQLLMLLRADAREPTASLARKLGVARATVQNRIERLKRDGVISGFTVRRGDGPDGHGVRAHVMITLKPKTAARAEHGLRAMPEVEALYSISGVYDMIAVVGAETVARMDDILDHIRSLEGIERTTSSIILATKFRR